MAPKNATRDQLAGAPRAALGRGPRWAAGDGWKRSSDSRAALRRASADDGDVMKAITYLWENSGNFWPITEHDGDPAAPFSPGTGLDLFEAAHERLETLGLRVLEITWSTVTVPTVRPTSRSSRTCPARTRWSCATATRVPRSRP
ncbi:hypothetical protein [Streptomyces canus]|uniref:hypothetical protein n=2 Tax=Streptomyces canus TaxID=58343 RepID=UPI002B1CFBF4|nr:hypothetical protein [Streptomyces canus]